MNNEELFSQFDQAALRGDFDRFSPIGSFEFGEDGTDVEFTGALGNHQFGGDLFVALALRDKLQNLDFARREIDGISQFVSLFAKMLSEFGRNQRLQE